MQLPVKFRYLLLRPPRFGKSVFLSILKEYYDIHGADQFPQYFGSLAVATNPDSIPTHNQHLCLSFRLPDVYICSDIRQISSHLRVNVWSALSIFIYKYAAELQLSDPSTFLQREVGDMLAQVFVSAWIRFYLFSANDHICNRSWLGLKPTRSSSV